MQKKSMIVLGSTGSVGEQTLDVARKENIRVSAISANTSVEKAERQAREFKVDCCAMADENIIVEKFSSDGTTKTNAKVLTGEDLYHEIARLMGANLNIDGIKVAKELKMICENYKNSQK